MKLLRLYVSDVAHIKVRPIAGLRCWLRKQHNMSVYGFSIFIHHIPEHANMPKLDDVVLSSITMSVIFYVS